jgi:DNA-damage-inducible protein J
MAQVNVSIEMNEKLKNEFEETCEKLGLEPEEAINIFAQKVVNEQGIPFEINEEDYPDAPSWKDKAKQYLKTGTLILSVVGALSLIGCVFAHKSKKK